MDPPGFDHPNIGGLAGSLASLYSMVGDNDTAMKYALAWQNRSISSQDKWSAAAFIERLKSAELNENRRRGAQVRRMHLLSHSTPCRRND